MEYFEELGDLGYFDQDYDIEYSVSMIHCNDSVSILPLRKVDYMFKNTQKIDILRHKKLARTSPKSCSWYQGWQRMTVNRHVAIFVIIVN